MRLLLCLPALTYLWGWFLLKENCSTFISEQIQNKIILIGRYNYFVIHLFIDAEEFLQNHSIQFYYLIIIRIIGGVWPNFEKIFAILSI